MNSKPPKLTSSSFQVNTPSQDNRANQLNPNNERYWKSRGQTPRTLNRVGQKTSRLKLSSK